MPTTHKSLLQADPLNTAQRKRYSFLYQYHLRMYDYCEKNEVSSEQLFRHALVCVYPFIGRLTQRTIRSTVSSSTK
jgi:hypothetical protein